MQEIRLAVVYFFQIIELANRKQYHELEQITISGGYLDMYKRYHLSQNDAQKIVDHLTKKLNEGDLEAAIAVADSQGELIAFLRTDGCPLPSIQNAMNKAFTAAREKTESGNIGQTARDEKFPITNFGDLRYTGWGGGVPVIYQGQVVGAIGVSGLPEQDDIQLARQAADLIMSLI